MIIIEVYIHSTSVMLFMNLSLYYRVFDVKFFDCSKFIIGDSYPNILLEVSLIPEHDNPLENMEFGEDFIGYTGKIMLL